MIHEMKLRETPFNSIKAKEKTVEMRLNDEKRKLIKIGDIIVFTNIETSEKIQAKVVGLKNYKDFFELYQDCNKHEIGYKSDEIANAEDMYEYYSKDLINKYGTLAIKISVL